MKAMMVAAEQGGPAPVQQPEFQTFQTTIHSSPTPIMNTYTTTAPTNSSAQPAAVFRQYSTTNGAFPGQSSPQAQNSGQQFISPAMQQSSTAFPWSTATAQDAARSTSPPAMPPLPIGAQAQQPVTARSVIESNGQPPTPGAAGLPTPMTYQVPALGQSAAMSAAAPPPNAAGPTATPWFVSSPTTGGPTTFPAQDPHRIATYLPPGATSNNPPPPSAMTYEAQTAGQQVASNAPPGATYAPPPPAMMYGTPVPGQPSGSWVPPAAPAYQMPPMPAAHPASNIPIPNYVMPTMPPAQADSSANQFAAMYTPHASAPGAYFPPASAVASESTPATQAAASHMAPPAGAAPVQPYLPMYTHPGASTAVGSYVPPAANASYVPPASATVYGLPASGQPVISYVPPAATATYIPPASAPMQPAPIPNRATPSMVPASAPVRHMPPESTVSYGVQASQPAFAAQQAVPAAATTAAYASPQSATMYMSVAPTQAAQEQPASGRVYGMQGTGAAVASYIPPPIEATSSASAPGGAYNFAAPPQHPSPNVQSTSVTTYGMQPASGPSGYCAPQAMEVVGGYATAPGAAYNLAGSSQYPISYGQPPNMTYGAQGAGAVVTSYVPPAMETNYLAPAPGAFSNAAGSPYPDSYVQSVAESPPQVIAYTSPAPMQGSYPYAGGAQESFGPAVISYTQAPQTYQETTPAYGDILPQPAQVEYSAPRASEFQYGASAPTGYAAYPQAVAAQPAAASSVFEMLDLDKDGVLTREEFERATGGVVMTSAIPACAVPHPNATDGVPYSITGPARPTTYSTMQTSQVTSAQGNNAVPTSAQPRRYPLSGGPPPPAYEDTPRNGILGEYLALLA